MKRYERERHRHHESKESIVEEALEHIPKLDKVPCTHKEYSKFK